MVHIKQAFTVPPERQATTRVTSIARTVPRVPASLDGDALMERIRADGMELCVVIDEYGGTAGIVTTEDLIEEILGDVTDEHDYERADVVPIDGNGYLCAGLLRIDELYDATGYHAPDGPYDTLGGLIMYCLGRIPTVDDVVDLPRRSPVGDGDGSPEMPEARDDVTWRATVAPRWTAVESTSSHCVRPPHPPNASETSHDIRRKQMGDLWAVVLAFALLVGNAFFVGAEFSLISARRDRLEALAESGKSRARTVIRAGENLSLMLAGAQLGITICSILLGRVGEPAVAHLIEKPLELAHVPHALLHPISFAIALSLVVVLHILLGEMVPKNIALAGPESAAMLLVPAHLMFIRLVRPLISFYNWTANISLRLMRVEPKDELESTVSLGELAQMLGESKQEGLIDAEEHERLTRALQSIGRTVTEVMIPPSTRCAASRFRCRRPAASGPRSAPWRRPSPRPASPASRSADRTARSPAICT